MLYNCGLLTLINFTLILILLFVPVFFTFKKVNQVDPLHTTDYLTPNLYLTVHSLKKFWQDALTTVRMSI